MKVVFTKPAIEDLDEIHTYLAAHYPHVMASVERRFSIAFARISKWPESAQLVVERDGVRVAPLIRYPYKIFYRVHKEVIEILHIHHSARR